MTMPAVPSHSKPSGDEPGAAAGDQQAALTSEEKLHRFWKSYGRAVILFCVVVLIAILARGGWDLYSAQREKAVEADYAAAGTPEKLSAFAAANPGHALAGIALLRIADGAYAAGKFGEAQANYDKAAATLKSGAFASRAQLGAAMARLGLGKTSEGEAALRQLSADAGQSTAIRAEATYHLASLAADAGRVADVTKLSEQLMQMDGSSPWTQRALALRARMPVSAAPEAKKENAPGASAPPLISLPAAGK
jgi:hypothetical protein